MDFTEIYKQTGHLVQFSPGTSFALSAVGDRLVVRQVSNFQITRSWLVDTAPSASTTLLSSQSGTRVSATDGAISHIGWSKDSEYILAACAKRGIVNVYAMRDDQWNARIEAGAEGLVRAEWAPDGRNILCFSEWGLRVTIWSLVTGTATYIQYPKHPDRGYAFRKDGRYLVLAERHKSKDTLGIYDATESYKLAKHLPLPTSSLASLSLSPNGNNLALWEGPLEYKLYIITLAGQQLATFVPEPDPGLGIRHASWHPSGSFLAVAGWDDKIHIISSLGWTCVATFELSSRVAANVRLWKEPTSWLEATHGRGFFQYDRPTPNPPIPVLRPDPTKPSPKSGAIQLDWNVNGTLLLARFEHAPTSLHLFSFPLSGEPFNPTLSTVLIHEQPILHARLNPVMPHKIVLCCGNGAMYIWSKDSTSLSSPSSDLDDHEVAECIGIPAEAFDCKDVRWAPDGKGIILMDREGFCAAFEVTD